LLVSEIVHVMEQTHSAAFFLTLPVSFSLYYTVSF